MALLAHFPMMALRVFLQAFGLNTDKNFLLLSDCLGYLQFLTKADACLLDGWTNSPKDNKV